MSEAMLKSPAWENRVLASTQEARLESDPLLLQHTSIFSTPTANRTPRWLQFSNKSSFFQLKYAVQNVLYFYWLMLATYPQVGGNATQNSQGKAVLPQISSQLPVEPVVQSPKLLARCPHCYLHRRGLKGCVLGCEETIFFRQWTLGCKG